MRIKLVLTYDGTSYSGWQRQKTGVSVQQTVEEGIEKLTGEKVKIIGSGRTDAGVHALGQVAHFDTESKIPPEKFYLALNTLLPESVKALSSEKVSDNFNARRDAKRKTYCYNIYLSRVEEPLKDRYAVRILGKLDVEKMRNVAKVFVGEHDFKCLSASGNSTKTTTRTIYDIDIKEDGENITFTVIGNGFLYNMVRILCGTLIKAGRGDLDENTAIEMLKTGNRELGGDTLPAKALCLKEVVYE